MTFYYFPTTGEALQHDQLAHRFPETSIPAPALGALDAGSMELLGLVPLTVDPAPEADFGWSVVPTPVEQRDGAYRQGWRLVAWPADQVADALDRRRRTVLDAVDARAGALLDAGFGFDFGGQDGVLHLQLRGLDDQTSWLVLRSSASELIEAGMGAELLPMRTAENVTVYRPATVIRQVLQAMTAYGLKVRGAAWALKDQVNDAKTLEALDRIDITKGWPA